jgi:tetratricopeptide (TPR) repeat protein
MDYQEYVRAKQQAEQLVQNGKLKEAVDAFYKLILTDISEIDKASLCVALANVYDKQGNTDEALAWYNKGIAAEQAYYRFEVAEKKAQYLSVLGRSSDGVKIYEELVKQPFVSEAEKERMRQMTKTLLTKSMGRWK